MNLTRVLMLRMSGNDVKFIQTKLKEHGFFKEMVDGYFSQNTLLAVFNFQRHVGIKGDGVIGMQTWSQLINYEPMPQLSNNNNIIVNKDIDHKISFIGENGLKIYDCLLPEDEYYKEDSKKEFICLDITDGNSRADWTIFGWEKDFKKDKNGNITPIIEAAHYVIGRKSSSTNDDIWDGKILRAFDDRYWSNYINSKDKDIAKKAIIVSLCNYGHLTRGIDGRFYNNINKPVNDTDVVELENDFKGYKYWEKITDQQIESLKSLLLYLTHKYGMDLRYLNINDNSFDYDKNLNDNVIKSHSQFSKDKLGIFPQKELIEMLKSL
jgi:hypothetical protein